jgi:hypothetical protein
MPNSFNDFDTFLNDSPEKYSCMAVVMPLGLCFNFSKPRFIEKVSLTISKFAEQDYTAVSRAIGIDKDEISRVIAELAAV